jgi:pyrimidine-nucleoside phosphorylase/thymidine phosphorylase
MNVCDTIYRKRRGERLSTDEIRCIVSRYTAGAIPDYQMSAFLMAVVLRGMDAAETAALTQAMTESGDVIDLSDIPGVKVDKHSTGGVGDGISLVLAPLAASAGVVVPMMSGRGLAHTGGTLDKLESIPGFRTDLNVDEYRGLLRRIGVAMVGQTDRVAPADKKIYALRDVTATVDSLPLISASIMCKKLAEGCDALVLDVKTGSGAFMQTLDEARALATAMVGIGSSCGKKIIALITNMNQPLGNAVGNALEIAQAIEVLKGGGPSDFIELTLELGVRMLLLGGIEKDKDRARARLVRCINSGSALAKFAQLIEGQGGDPRVIDRPDVVLPRAPEETMVISAQAGYVAAIDTRAVGMAAVMLGAGRATKDDRLDYGAGIIIRKKLGDRVESNEPLATLRHGARPGAAEARDRVLGAYRICENKLSLPPLVYEEIVV